MHPFDPVFESRLWQYKANLFDQFSNLTGGLRPSASIRRPCWASVQIRSEQLVARARQILSVASGPAQFSVLF
jgi:hypothetical protein